MAENIEETHRDPVIAYCRLLRQTPWGRKISMPHFSFILSSACNHVAIIYKPARGLVINTAIKIN